MPAWGASIIRRWVKHLKNRNMDITDQSHYGQPGSITSERNEQKVDELISEDQRVTVREIAAQVGKGHHAIQEMIATLGLA